MTEIYKNLDKLTPWFREKVKSWINEVGDIIFITESRRSIQRQYELYGYGRSTSQLKKVWVPVNYANPNQKQVTWTLSSNHIKGIAVDIAFNGKELYPSDNGKRREIADCAKKHGIKWWFDLRGKDKPHFEDNLIYTNNNTNKMTKYIDEFNDEVALGYNPILKVHDGDQNLTEAEIKNLLEIFGARLEKRIKDYIDNKLLSIKNSI